MASKLVLTSLQQSLSAASSIPSDIKFVFKKETNGVKTVQEIRAHKLILALVSNVFEKAFYGGLRDDGCIEIKDATKESFEAMINYIYTKETDVSIYGFEMLCSIYYLADKYNLSALKEETLKAIKIKDISADNILSVGLLADQHSAHEELTEILYVKATKSLGTIFDGQLTKVINFFAEVDAGNSPDLCRIAVRLMAKLKTTPPVTVCSNCKASPCLSGVEITRTNLVPGAKVSGVPGIGSEYRILEIKPDDSFSFFGIRKDGSVSLSRSLDPNYYVYNCFGK